MRNQVESKVQQQSVRWFRLQYPNIIITSFPNQGVRSVANSSRMKAEGMLAGCPDIVIFSCGIEQDLEGDIPIPYFALFIEFKTDKGVLSKVQKEVHEKLRNAGYKVAVCRSFDDFKQTVEDYLK